MEELVSSPVYPTANITECYSLVGLVKTIGVWNFRFVLQCSWGLHSFRMLHSIRWQLVAYFLGQPVSPETSVNNCQPMLHNIPEERRPQQFVSFSCQLQLFIEDYWPGGFAPEDFLNPDFYAIENFQQFFIACSRECKWESGVKNFRLRNSLSLFYLYKELFRNQWLGITLF